MGLRKFFKKVGKVAKKALPFAAAALPFIPGVNALAAPIMGGISKFLGGSSAQSNSAVLPDQDDNVYGTMGKSDAPYTSPPVSVTAPRMGGGSGPDWMGLVKDTAPAFLGYLGQKQTNAANAQQAQKQMDFQEEQTSSSYQRGVADMKAAGLNPMLAYSQGGAASGGGAQATMGNEVGAGIATAMQAKMQTGQLQQLAAQTENVQADTGNKETSNALIEAQTEESRARRTTELLRPGVLTAEERKLVLGNLLSEATLQANIRAGHSAADFASDHARREKALANIDTSGQAKARAYEDWYKSGLGRTEPDMHYWTQVANSASNVADKLNPFKWPSRSAGRAWSGK